MIARKTGVVALTSFLSVSTLTAQVPAQDDAAVREFVSAFQTAWNARDASAVAALYAENADQILGPYGSVSGRAAIERQWAALLPSIAPGRTNTIRVERVRFIDPGLAVVDVTGNFAGGRSEAGDPLPRSSDRATYVLQRNGSRWTLSTFRVFEAEVEPGARHAIDAARARFTEAWLRGDATAAAAVFAPNSINSRPGAADERGRQAIERMFASFLGEVTMEHVELIPQDLDVRPYVAYEFGTLVQRYLAEGASAVTQIARYSAVWRREPGGDWQYDRFLFNWMPAPR